MLVLITRFKKNNQPAACLRKRGRNFLPSEHAEERHSSEPRRGPLCPLSPVVRLCTHLLAACLSVGVEADTGPPTCASPGLSW